jgi:hypothetical protein
MIGVIPILTGRKRETTCYGQMKWEEMCQCIKSTIGKICKYDPPFIVKMTHFQFCFSVDLQKLFIFPERIILFNSCEVDKYKHINDQ